MPLLLAWALLTTGACAQIFDVTAFGAVGDGTTDDTVAVRAAAAALAFAGGGLLRFPAPGQFVSGSFNLSSNCVLEVEGGAEILGSQQGQQWPLVVAATVWPQFGHGSDCEPGTESCRLMHQALIFAWNAHNITLQGSGVIDARGAPWWACAKDLSLAPCSGYGRPNLLFIGNVSDVEMKDLFIRNSPEWTLHFSSVTNLWVHNVNVTNPAVGAPNSDGIDIDCTQNVVVEDSYFNVGDDALCVKSGIDYFGRLYNRPSKNIIFRRIVVGHGHGITIGSEMSGSVFNVTFEDISMNGTEFGPRIKSQRGRGGVVTGIVFRNITAAGVGAALDITMEYTTGIPPTNKTATPVFANFLLEDMVFSGSSNGGIVHGLPESLIQNVTLRNVTFNGGHVTFQQCDNVVNAVCADVYGCPPCFSK